MNGYIERGIDQVDEAEVLAFVNTILEGECGLRVRDQLRRSIQKYFAEFKPEGRLFVALFQENTLRALVAVDRINETRGILKWIFVASGDRGQGIGSGLLDRAIGFAQDAGYELLVLGTMTEMEAAHRLYKKKGFVFKQRVKFWHRPMMVYEKTLKTNGSDRMTS
ncbi:MAG: GNAT family N-acetyltransferase [bacterium]|nr:GNAT family N-acetyltransferase [bacterium]